MGKARTAGAGKMGSSNVWLLVEGVDGVPSIAVNL